RIRVEHSPTSGPAWFFPAKKQPCRISLRGVIIARTGQGFCEINLGPPGHRFMVQQTVDREAEPTDVRLEQDQPAALCEHAAGLVQKDSRGAQVMKDVEQDQVRKAAADKWQFVPVTDQIEPGIREKVGAD